MRVLTVEEGAPFSISDNLAVPLRVACKRLGRQLRTRSRVLEEADGKFVVCGVIGTISLSPGTVLDVKPKVGAGEDWIAATLDLLLAHDRIEIAGNRRAGLARNRNILDVLAGIYAERLRRALRRDGPILVMERRGASMPMLKGKLQATTWARHAAWEPNRFPVSFQELLADNDYSRSLAYVAGLLARGTNVPRIRGSLLSSACALRPGAPELVHADAHVALRRLPSQWAAYEPAWDIAVSVLTRRSLLASSGTRHGVSLAIEAWHLLERLLERALQATVRIGRENCLTLSAPRKCRTPLLRDLTPEKPSDRSVIPDGRLADRTGQLATFEAKYAKYSLSKGPPREHVFQALATAAACASPLAVLVYPSDFVPQWWAVEGFGERPKHLVSVGLGLFDYRRGAGDLARGQRLLALLDGPPASASVSTAVASKSVLANAA